MDAAFADAVEFRRRGLLGVSIARAAAERAERIEHRRAAVAEHRQAVRTIRAWNELASEHIEATRTAAPAAR